MKKKNIESLWNDLFGSNSELPPVEQMEKTLAEATSLLPPRLKLLVTEVYFEGKEIMDIAPSFPRGDKSGSLGLTRNRIVEMRNKALRYLRASREVKDLKSLLVGPKYSGIEWARLFRERSEAISKILEQNGGTFLTGKEVIDTVLQELSKQ